MVQKSSTAKEENMSSKNSSPCSGNKKIWIDLDNSPHVLFFDPIIKELKTRGYDVVVTARDFAQVIGLADLFKLEYTKIGHHYGKNLLFKIAGLIIRACQMIPFALREKPDLAISHGSRTQIIAAGMARIQSMLAFDYEYTSRTSLPFCRPTKIIIPELLVKKITDRSMDEISPYPGIKEDVYVKSHIPDPAFLQSLNLSENDIIAAIRPPATVAHYHAPKSDELFQAVIEHLADQSGVKVIIVPRTAQQSKDIQNQWPQHFSSGLLMIPEQVVNGLDLIWYSDMVISAGGTMIREAAALGVPAYSIFGGKLGAVDQYLSESGRLTLIGNAEEVEKHIKIEKWRRPDNLQQTIPPALHSIVDAVEKMIYPEPSPAGLLNQHCFDNDGDIDTKNK